MFLSPGTKGQENLFWTVMEDAGWLPIAKENRTPKQLAEICLNADYKGPFELIFYCYYAFPTDYPDLLPGDQIKKEIMMSKRNFLLIAILILNFVIVVLPVLAQTDVPVCDEPPCVYVDPSRGEGNEDGTSTNPYNTPLEGEAFAQASRDGAWLFSRNADGTWSKIFVHAVQSGGGGVPFPKPTLYALLATLALALVAAGWYFQRRSQQLTNN